MTHPPRWTQLAQQRGYKRGWAERVYQAKLAKRHGIA
jgi:hypothetical protein